MNLLRLFWIFLKVNLLSTSGPASVGLLYTETVEHARIMTDDQFVQAVGVSSALPGSDALQLAMFVGHAAAGVPGALIALLGSILPPTILMLGAVVLLQRIRHEAAVQQFVRGITPAIVALMLLTAWKVLGEVEGLTNWPTMVIALASLVALLLDVHPALVVLGAGIAGILFLR
jgi:chromate transporter